MQTIERKFELTFQVAKREVQAKYKGSALGILWSALTPILMLTVYTLVFGSIFQSRWPSTGADAGIGEFAVILFTGLILFQFFSEIVITSPNIIMHNSNYVKKVVFPIEILVPVTLVASMFHMFVSCIVLLISIALVYDSIPLTSPLFLLILIPFCFNILGISWFLASLGVYIRDIGQIIGTLMTTLLFLAPILFPFSSLPEWLQPYILLNPLTIPVEAARAVLIAGSMPNFSNLGIYTLISIIVMFTGYFWFQKTRKGFADVL